MEGGRRTYILGDVNDSLELVLCKDEERARVCQRKTWDENLAFVRVCVCV